MRKSSLFGRLCLAAAGLLCTGASALGAPGDVVISQVWGGPSAQAGNANYIRADYVELFNRTDNPVSTSGWSLSIATTSGSWTKLDLGATIPAHSYYLVRASADATAGLAMPAHDAEFSPLSFTILSTTGRVCLRDTNVAISGSTCPTTNIIDLVTYGTSGTCFEGIARAPSGSTTGSGLAVFRRGDGCADTNDNANDFVTRTPAPRNSATAALASCAIGACCDNTTTGICLMDTAAGCAATAGYSFTTVGTTCQPHPCTPTGACCTTAALTTCNVRTQAACTTAGGRWILNAACLPDSACANTTSCCLPNGSCCPMVALLCMDQGGTPGAYEIGCTTVGNCIPPPANDFCSGALPLTLGTPVIGNSYTATFTGDGPTAPCLNSISASSKGVWFTFVPPTSSNYEFDTTGTQFNSDLVVFSVPTCADPSTWTVIGCDDQSVPSPTGATFCGSSGGATVAARLQGVPLQGGVTYRVRISLNGTINTFGNYRLVVNDLGAALTGACCFATNGRCELRTQAACTSAEAPLGTYMGNGVTCTPALCGTGYGACCSSGICQVRLEAGCTGTGVFWLDGAACEPSPCNLTPNPPNGTCATAAVVTDAQFPFSAIVGVNQAPDGPAISCSTATATHNAVWYVYTPPADGVVSAWDLGNRDVSVVVYDAGTSSPSCNSWTEVLCESTEADANFPAVAGHAYYILFTTPGTASTSVNDFYNILIKRVVPTTPTNIACVMATPLSSSPTMQSFPAGGAPFGPHTQCQSSTQIDARNAIWFTYSTGANDEMVRLQRANNQTFTSMQFYTDGCALTPYQCANLGTSNSFVQLRRNTAYTIMVHRRSGYSAGDATYQFIFDTSTPAVQVPNQDCATAQAITPPFLASVDNTMAFDEPPSLVVDCPNSSALSNPDAAGAAGVWYSYTPSMPSVVNVQQLDTGCISPAPAPCTARVDAVVAVFEGSCGGPRVLCSKNDTNTIGSNLFRAYPPNTYYILIALESSGIPNGATYPLQVSITADETLIPSNDDCATATSISALPYSDAVPIGGAHDDLPRAVCSAGTVSTVSRNGVWYTYHNGATAAGVLLSETGPLDSIVAAYSGDCGNLIREICVDDPESNMYLTLRPDTTYYFMVAKKVDFPAIASDTVSFNIEPYAGIIDPPANDTCEHSQAVTTMPFSYTGLPLAAANLFNPPSCAFNPLNLLVTQSTDPIWYAIDSGTGFTLHLYELASSPSVVWTLFVSCDQQFEQFCDVNEGTATVPRGFVLLPSTRYYLRVTRESNSDYTLGATPYNLTITAAPGSNGACCNGGPCTTTTIENCPSGFTPGGTCSPDPCAPATENCCRGTTCNSVASGSCTGVVAGSNSLVRPSCGTGTAFATCCYADFNHDGSQSIDDLFLYFNAYFTSSPWAKFSGNGVAQPAIDDLFLYINAYFGTCS